MPASVVTFSVQVGTTGFEIAHMVAAKLGYRYYDWDITAKATELVESEPEDVQSGFVDRLMTRLSTANVLEEEVPPTFIGKTPSLSQNALQTLLIEERRAAIEEVVRRLAVEGKAVIVGHGSQAVLREFPGVLKVLVRAPFKTRVTRLAEEQRTTREDALRTIAELDKLKSDFFWSAYSIDHLDAFHYDLTINNDEISVAAVAEMVGLAALHHGKNVEHDPGEVRSMLWTADTNPDGRPLAA